MSKIVSKGHKTWKDGSAMTYTVTDDGVLTISGSLRDGCLVPIKSKAPFRHLVIANGVESVGRDNFRGLDELEELTLAPSVKEIGNEAFSFCRKLKCIHFSEGLVTIGEEAFRGCVSLNGIRLPQTLSKIGYGAFMSCDALEKVRLPKGVKLGGADFCGCDSLREVVLPKGIEVIPGSTFDYCSALESISIPSSVRYIGDKAFTRCDKLQNIKLPEGVKIDKRAFCWEVKCEVKGEGGVSYIGTVYNIKTDRSWASIRPADKTDMEGDVIVPSCVEYEGKTYPVTVIEREAFHGMNIRSVVLPDSVVLIEDSAFMNCKRLREVYLGKSLRRIGMSAFAWCECLTYMPIPPSIERVGYRALYETRLVGEQHGVIYLGHILYGYDARLGHLPPHSYIEVREGTTVIADAAFNAVSDSWDYNNLEGIILPEGMKRIGEDAFTRCKGLSYVRLPKSLECIGHGAFVRTNVREVTLPWKRPVEAGSIPFDEGTVFLVPKGTAELYSKTGEWGYSRMRYIFKEK